MEMIGYALLGFCLCWTAFVSAQYGPVPPRPQQFAGATLVQPGRGNFRQRLAAPRTVPESILPADQAQLIQSRRAQQLPRRLKPQPVQPQLVEQQRTNFIEETPAPFVTKVTASPTPSPQFQTQTPKLTPRPVEEELEEGDEELPTTVVTTPSTTAAYTVPVRTSFPPSPLPVSAPVPPQPAQIPGAFQRPQFVQPSPFRPAVPQQAQPVQFAAPAPLQGRQLARQQVRPIQGAQVPASRQSVPQVLPPQITANQQLTSEDDPFFRQVQGRPPKKQEPARQQIYRQPEVVRQQPARAEADFTRPLQREPHTKAPQRERKPVAQTIRKYHEEHEDGSITWGYENDDGSFKEETIGVDCVTRGKYGYYDPDGVKREYTYQTGIPCDKVQESEEAASNQGFIDYTNNKYVLPNGDEIDLEAMVKNRARKPVSRYPNRA